MIVEIIRLETGSEGTFGVLKVNKKMLCNTLEPPSLFNKKDISCIPEGQYTCKLINSEKFGTVYQVMDVPNRSNILFHPGNYVSETSGCILLGQYMSTSRYGRCVLRSRDTIARFKEVVGGQNSFHLTLQTFF